MKLKNQIGLQITLKKEYPSASILKDNRIVYNIKGNDYRLIVKFNFEYQLAWIRFTGTHSEYDMVNANEIKDENKTY